MSSDVNEFAVSYFVSVKLQFWGKPPWTHETRLHSSWIRSLIPESKSFTFSHQFIPVFHDEIHMAASELILPSIHRVRSTNPFSKGAHSLNPLVLSANTYCLVMSTDEEPFCLAVWSIEKHLVTNLLRNFMETMEIHPTPTRKLKRKDG